MVAPSRSWREPAARSAPKRRGPEPAAHVRTESYLWALAGVPSSPCSSTAPWQLLAPQPPAAGTPGRRGGGPPAGSTQPGVELPAWPPSPSRSVLAPRRGHPSSGQTLLINRRTRRSRQRRRQPAFISARRGGPARLPVLTGALPAAGYPGAPSCALARGRQGAPALSPLPPPPCPRSQPRGGGDIDLTSPRKPKRKMPSLCKRGASPPPSSDLMGDWQSVYQGHPALLFPVHLHSTTMQLRKNCLPRLPPNLPGLRMDCVTSGKSLSL